MTKVDQCPPHSWCIPRATVLPPVVKCRNCGTVYDNSFPNLEVPASGPKDQS